jgi:hypothetical protein
MEGKDLLQLSGNKNKVRGSSLWYGCFAILATFCRTGACSAGAQTNVIGVFGVLQLPRVVVTVAQR